MIILFLIYILDLKKYLLNQFTLKIKSTSRSKTLWSGAGGRGEDLYTALSIEFLNDLALALLSTSQDCKLTL